MIAAGDPGAGGVTGCWDCQGKVTRWEVGLGAFKDVDQLVWPPREHLEPGPEGLGGGIIALENTEVEVRLTGAEGSCWESGRGGEDRSLRSPT